MFYQYFNGLKTHCGIPEIVVQLIENSSKEVSISFKGKVHDDFEMRIIIQCRSQNSFDMLMPRMKSGSTINGILGIETTVFVNDPDNF
jgi:hypothetical protein